MLAASDASEYQTTKLFFMSYILIVTVFFCNLFVGVILNLYQEVNDLSVQTQDGNVMTSLRIYDVLEPYYRHHGERERQKMLADMTDLNWKLREIHEAIRAGG